MHFSAFFRISNLVATTSQSFDPMKQLCMGDVILEPSYVIVLVKWSKTLQKSKQGSFVILPKLASQAICPWQAYHNLAVSSNSGSNVPLFNIKGVPVTQAQVRTHLAKILRILGLDPPSYTFHTFRQSGATLAYNLDVNVQKIKRHGTWSSDTVQTYIINDPANASGVASAFQKHFAASIWVYLSPFMACPSCLCFGCLVGLFLLKIIKNVLIF